jgi:hypothetical protein
MIIDRREHRQQRVRGAGYDHPTTLYASNTDYPDPPQYKHLSDSTSALSVRVLPNKPLSRLNYRRVERPSEIHRAAQMAQHSAIEARRSSAAAHPNAKAHPETQQ